MGSLQRSSMLMTLVKRRAAASACALQLMAAAAVAMPIEVQNPTGLPVYPNVGVAYMENRLKTDVFGRWCIHVSAQSSDSLETVENWYRGAMLTASETDLRHDGTYGNYVQLDGIKLSKDLDYVAVYTVSKGATTSIDITRCSPIR
jgi:hypothetical protein